MGPAPTASCASWNETGDMKKVVDYIIEETEAGIYETEESAVSGNVNQVLKEVAVRSRAGRRARATR